MSYKEKRQNANMVFVGFDYGGGTALIFNTIYATQFMPIGDAITKGITLNFYGYTGSSNITIGIADSNGKIIKKSIKTTPLNISGLSVNSYYTYNFNFDDKIKLKRGKTYFFLIQYIPISGSAVINAVTQGSAPVATFLCGTSTGNLTTVKKISPPIGYIDAIATIGNLY